MKHALLTLIGAWLIGCISHAQTPVSGTIVGQTWTMTGSPYHVIGDVLVAGLTIEPGVTVSAQGDYVIEIAGVITAIGTRCDSVLFTKSDSIDHWRGIYFNSSNPGSTLSYCRIEGSHRSGLHLRESTPTISHCSFSNNTGILGGGVYLESGTAVLTDCRISGNQVDTTNNPGVNGSIIWWGAGIYSNGMLVMQNCEIDSNELIVHSTNQFNTSARALGAGLYSTATARSILRNCVVRGNVAHAIGTSGFGCTAISRGAGAYFDGQFEMTNSIVDHNVCISEVATIIEEGSGVYSASAAPSSFVNCTISYNNSEGLRHTGTGTVAMSNSVVFFNSPMVGQLTGIPSIDYCDIEGGYAGTGNIDINPIFLSTTDLIIVPGSLCIDAGNPVAAHNDHCLPPSLGGDRNDIGAHGGPLGCSWSCEVECPDTTSLSTSYSVNAGDCTVGLEITGGVVPYTVVWVDESGQATYSEDLVTPFPGWNGYTITNSGGGCAAENGFVFVDCIVGSPEHESAFSLLPNPFTDMITISGQTAIQMISISDLLGRELQLSSWQQTSFTWNARTTSGTEVPPGLYLVTVIADGQRYTQRVVKQ